MLSRLIFPPQFMLFAYVIAIVATVSNAAYFAGVRGYLNNETIALFLVAAYLISVAWGLVDILRGKRRGAEA